MDVEKRVKLMEEAIMMLRDLIIRHDERLDKVEKDGRNNAEDFNFKLNALVDSQIRNEGEFKEVKDSITELKETIIELRKLSESTIKRVENLENQK